MMLADLGADVIKVEEPGGGRRAREERELSRGGMLPHLADERRWRTISPLERNKKSIAIDLRSEIGHQIAIKLVETSDVIVEGFRPGVMSRLGLDYARMREINPQIVYCSISGFGQSGRRSNLPGHDLNYLAHAGALSLIGTQDGKPVVPINVIADFAGGSLMAVIGILSAVVARSQIGEGQYVDIAMVDGVVSLLGVEIAKYVATGVAPRAGATSLTGAAAYYNTYETKDGRFLAIGCNEPHFFRRLCEILNTPDLIEQQFADRTTQIKTQNVFRHVFLQRTLHDWLEIFTTHDIPVAPVLDLGEVLDDQLLRDRGLLIEQSSQEHGSFPQAASPIHLSRSLSPRPETAPFPGQHTREILADLGFDDAQIDRFISLGAVQEAETRT